MNREKIKKLASFTAMVGGLYIFLHDYFYHFFKNKQGKTLTIHLGYIGLLLMLIGFIIGLPEFEEIQAESA